MANTDNPNGFSLAEPLRKARWARKGSAAIYKGDLCAIGSDGLVVVAAAAGEELVGVALAFAAAADAEVFLASDQDQEYFAQSDGAETPAVSLIGNNVDLLATAGVTTWGGTSLHELNGATFATTTAQLRVLGAHPSDDPTADFCRWRVVINESHFAKKTAGI